MNRYKCNSPVITICGLFEIGDFYNGRLIIYCQRHGLKYLVYNVEENIVTSLC